MGKTIPMLAMVAALSLPFTQPASAIYCSNCGTEWTQLANNLQLAEQLVQQTEMVAQAVRRLETMQLNTNGLDEQIFGEALNDLRQTMDALAQARALSLSSGDLDNQFASKFEDYDAYRKFFRSGKRIDKWQQWSEDTNSSVLAAMKAGQGQAEAITGSEQDLLRDLETMSQTAEGRMQAMQIANQIALASARQMQKLRQLILTNLQMQANYIQTQMDRDAAAEAEWRSFISKKIKRQPAQGF